jgi:hypothetical protein
LGGAQYFRPADAKGIFPWEPVTGRKVGPEDNEKDHEEQGHNHSHIQRKGIMFQDGLKSFPHSCLDWDVGFRFGR